MRFSAIGSCVSVGATPESIGDFDRLLLTVNPSLLSGPANYPDTWSPFSVALTGLTGPTLGRVAFRYFVTDAGANGPNSSIIGIDGLAIRNPAASAAPEPSAILLVLIGLTAAVGATYRPHTGYRHSVAKCPPRR